MDPKAWWGSKTIWFNILTLVVAVLMAVSESPILAEYPQATEVLLMVVGVINLILRSVTSRALTTRPA